jgi:hypothetical protein
MTVYQYSLSFTLPIQFPYFVLSEVTVSFSEDAYTAREVDGSFSPIIVLSGETAIPVTIAVIPMEISEAMGQAIDSVRATSKHIYMAYVGV